MNITINFYNDANGKSGDSARRYRHEEDVQENGDVIHGGSGGDLRWDGDEARGRGAVEVKRGEKRVRNNRSTAGTDRRYRHEEDVQENGDVIHGGGGGVLRWDGDEARGRGAVEVKRAGKRVRGGPTGGTDSARRYRRDEDVQENGEVLPGGGEDAEWDGEK